MRLALAFGFVCVWLTAGMASATQLPSHAGMYLAQQGSAPVASLALVDSRVEAAVHGAIVTVVVHQKFHSDAEHVTEATYIFPLPEDAAVTAMAITTGDRTIHAAIAARADAQKRYEDAVSAGVGAALLEQERPDVFTQTVSAIPARGDVEVVIRYDTLARPRGDGSWQLALPLVVAPRYVPGTASGRPTTGAGHAPDTDRSPDASRVTPGGKPNAGGATDVAISFADGVDDVTSPTDAIAAHGAAWELRDEHSDHDVLIRWRGKQQDSGWVEQEQTGDGGYAAAVVSAPPAKARAAGAAALDVTLIVDRSAAAHGDADATERPLVRELLAALTQADAVTTVGSVTVARQAPADAWRVLDGKWSASPGAFDLTRALRELHGSGGAIVLVTPGLVSDDAAALAAARALKVPVQVVGVGPAPNRALLVAIAAATGGTVRFIAPDDDAGAIARDVVSDVATQPAALAVSWGVLAASDVVPAVMPRLGAGQARLVLARVQRAVAANGRARGDVFALAMTTAEPTLAGATTPRGPLARRWARDKLGELLDSGSAKPDVAAATALALRYGLVSPYTSMIAIGDEVVVRGGVKHTISVPVSVPAGMRWQPVERELHVVTKAELESDKHGESKDGKGTNYDPSAEAPPEPQKKTEHKSPPASPHTDAPKHAPSKQPAPQPAPRPKAEPVATNGTAQTTPAPAAPPPPPAPVAADASRETGKAGGNRRDDGDDGDDDEERSTRRKTAVTESADAPISTAMAGEDAETFVAESMAAPRRARRLALALGGGLTLNDPTGLVTLGASIERGRGRGSLGGEATLWLVGGTHGQGRLLGTLSLLQLDRLTLGLGAGVHVADALGLELGPALAAFARYDLTRHLGVYLRYDGALLFGDGTHGEHAATAGAEWRW